MTKFNLPNSIIHELFDKEILDDLRTILKELDNEKNIDILFDSDEIENLFFDLNPQKYYNKQFRKFLLQRTYDTNRFAEFCSILNIKMNNDISKDEFLIKLSNFKWSNNDETRAFVKAYDLDESIIPKTKLSELQLITLKPNSDYYDQMFDYQFKIFFESQKLLTIDNKRFIIQMPTGGGKTKVAMEIVTEFLNLNQIKVVIWLALTKELCKQASQSFKSIWKHRGKQLVHLNQAWDNNQIIKNNNSSILIITTLQKIMSYVKKYGSDDIKADLIIFDEAHHAIAPKYSELIQSISNFAGNVIGLTATPGRKLKPLEEKYYEDEIDTSDENAKLSNMFDNEILSITLPNDDIGTIEYLQNIGVLAHVKKIPPIRINTNIPFSQNEIDDIISKNDYTKKILEKIGRDYTRNLELVKLLLEIGKNKKQTLYFGTSLPQARLVYVILKYFGYKAAYVDGKTSSEIRNDVVEKFKNKEIQFLCNYEVFVAGFDAPSVEVVFIGRPTKSPITLMQMIGRGMRGPNVKNGTKEFELYYIADGILDQFISIDQIFSLFDYYYNKH